MQVVWVMGTENASMDAGCWSSAMICGEVVEEVDPPKKQESPALIYYEEGVSDSKHGEIFSRIIDHGKEKAGNLLKGATSLFPYWEIVDF